MSSNRRDFLKGFAAVAAAVPSLAFGRHVKAEPALPEESPGPSPALTGPSGLQKHGKQPEFYIHSWDLEHFVNQMIDGSGRRIVIREEEDILRMEVYTEYPTELLAWCEKNLLVVELPQINKTLRVKVNTVESALLGQESDVIMTIDGVVKS